MMTVSMLLESLRAGGRLADIDVVFASFVGRNTAGSPGLTLLAALVSNASSMNGETALPAERIWTRDALRKTLRRLALEAPAEDAGDTPVLPDAATVDAFADGLPDWPPSPDAFPAIFREISPGAPVGADAAPLILSDGLLYLGRMYQDEAFLRGYLLLHVGSRAKKPGAVDIPAVTSLELEAEQKKAVSAAVGSDFLVISGGPGTGKTTIVSVILALRTETADEIVLCAPTGKAQVRMKEALNSQLKNLRIRTDVIGRIQSSTIHRLLSWRGGSFRYGPDNRLPHKLIIVDECSMIDLSLMVSLLKAVRDDASVILLGDQYQLSSVDPGSVFGDVCGFLRAHHPECLAELTVSRRFREGGGIWTLKNAINDGRVDDAWNTLINGSGDVLHLPLPGRERLEAFLREQFRGAWIDSDGRPYHREETIDLAWSRFDRFRILTPMNKGLFGAENLNALARSILEFVPAGARRVRPEPGIHHPGETVLVLKNSYALNVFNGDVGILWYADANGRPATRTAGQKNPRLLVFFQEFGSDGRSWRGLPPETLPEHVPAYAFTIHKSQGSDYDRVLMVLPPAASGRSSLLTREIVYTGLTRAKSSAAIAVSEDVFRDAVAHGTDRVSGLKRLSALAPAVGEGAKTPAVTRSKRPPRDPDQMELRFDDL